LKKKSEESAHRLRMSVGGWIAIGMGVVFTGLAGIITLRGKRR